MTRDDAIQRLADAVKILVQYIPSCAESHHNPKDYHDSTALCPVVARYIEAQRKAMWAISYLEQTGGLNGMGRKR